MKKHTHTVSTAASIIYAVILSSTAYAQQAEPGVSAPSKTTASVVERDPFWPVNFSPVAENNTEKIKHQNLIKKKTNWPKLKLKGLTKTGKNSYVAILEHFGIVEPGDIISAKKDGLIYRWKINAITDKGISRTRLDVKESGTTLQNH